MEKVLTTKEAVKLILQNKKDIVVPEEYTEIGDEAFSTFDFIENITLPKNLKVIGKNAFSDCKSLKSIAIPVNIKKIESCAFYGCSSLENIDFSQVSELDQIGYRAFCECSNLKEVSLPYVGYIGARAFEKCEKIEKISFFGVNDWPDLGIFYGCSNVKEIVYLGEGQKGIEILKEFGITFKKITIEH